MSSLIVRIVRIVRLKSGVRTSSEEPTQQVVIVPLDALGAVAVVLIWALAWWQSR